MNARQMFIHPEVEDWHAYDRHSKVRARELAAEEALYPEIEALFAKGWTGEAVMLPRVSGVPCRVLWDVPFLDALRELVSSGDDAYIDALLVAEIAPADQKEAIRAKFRSDSFARWMNYYGDDVARVMAADEVAADAYNEGVLQ